MQLSALEAKQKRLKDWSAFMESGTFDPTLKSNYSAALQEYKSALVQCWKQGSISEDEAAKISDLERQLEQMNEQIRLSWASHTPIAKSYKRHTH